MSNGNDDTNGDGGAELSATAGSAFECWARHTIMDGKVVTYATGFEGDGRFPNPKKATGHFEVSASRNAVIVHRATIQTDWQLETFKAAIEAANLMHCELSACDGRPEWDQPNTEGLASTAGSENPKL